MKALFETNDPMNPVSAFVSIWQASMKFSIVLCWGRTSWIIAFQHQAVSEAPAMYSLIILKTWVEAAAIILNSVPTATFSKDVAS